MKLKIPPKAGGIFKESYKVIVLLTLFIFISLAFSNAFARSKEVGEKKKRVESIEPTKALPVPSRESIGCRR